MSDYAHLLSPGRIGGMELRNRIFMTPQFGKGNGLVVPAIGILGPEGKGTRERFAGWFKPAQRELGAALVQPGSGTGFVGRKYPVKCNNGILVHPGFLVGLAFAVPCRNICRVKTEGTVKCLKGFRVPDEFKEDTSLKKQDLDRGVAQLQGTVEAGKSFIVPEKF